MKTTKLLSYEPAKQYPVKAIQFNGTEESADAIISLFQGKFDKVIHPHGGFVLCEYDNINGYIIAVVKVNSYIVMGDRSGIKGYEIWGEDMFSMRYVV